MKKIILLFFLVSFKISFIFSKDNLNLTNFIQLTNYFEATNYIYISNFVFLTNYTTNSEIITNFYTYTNIFTNYIIITNHTKQKTTEQRYYIQVGIFLNKRFAENLIKKLKSQNLNPYILDNYPYYKVCIGKNLTEIQARKILNKLKIKAIIKNME